MAKVRFDSPGQMILAGIGILILGIILLGFGIGFIGAIVGIWWIIKGISWQFKIWNYKSGQKRKYKQSNQQYLNQLGSQIRVKVQEVDNAVSSRDYPRAALLSASLSTDFPELKPEFKQQFVRDAAFYSAVSSDFVNAERYNNDSRFDNPNDPDYHSVYAMIFMGQGKFSETQQALETASKFPNRGRYYDFVYNTINQAVNSALN